MADEEHHIVTRLPSRAEELEQHAPVAPRRPAYGTPPKARPVPSLTPDEPPEPLPFTPKYDRDRSWQGYEEVWDTARAETRREAEEAFAAERAKWQRLVLALWHGHDVDKIPGWMAELEVRGDE
jgi:hypothetical protein